MFKIKNILKEVLRHKVILLVFFVFLVPRVLGLGYDIWNIDAPKWDYRSDRFIQKLIEGDLKETYQMYHPGVTVMWLSGLSKKLFYLVFNFYFGYPVTQGYGLVYPEWFYLKSFVAKFPLVLVISLIFTYSIFLLKKIGMPNRFLTFLVIILSLEPFYLGVTRLFHLSGLESAFGWLAFILAYYFYKTKSQKFLVLSGVSIGLSFLTKTSGILYLPIVCLLAFESVIPLNKESFKNISAKKLKSILGIGAIAASSVALTIFILFPAMWVNFLGVLTAMYKEGIVDTGFGGGPGETITNITQIFYLEKLVLRSTLLLLVSIFFSLFLMKKEKNLELKRLLIYSLLYIVMFNVVMVIPNKLKDRYLATIYPFIIFIASYGIYVVTLKIKNINSVFLLVLFYYSITFFTYFPNFSGYHTDVFWGYRGIPNFNIIKNRGEFYVSAIKYLNKVDEERAYEKSVVVTSSQRNISAVGYLGSVYISDFSIPNNRKADYFLINYTEENELPVDRNCYYMESFGPRFPFKFDYLKLYRCPNP